MIHPWCLLLDLDVTLRNSEGRGRKEERGEGGRERVEEKERISRQVHMVRGRVKDRGNGGV